MGAQLQAAE